MKWGANCAHYLFNIAASTGGCKCHWQRRRPPLFALILAWCNDRVRATAPFARARLSPSPASDVICDARWPDEAPAVARYSYDASLLFRRMAALQVDRDELASDDPLLFRELQGLC